MKRVGVIHSLLVDPLQIPNLKAEDIEAMSLDLERTRQSLAKTFPGVRFMVVAWGSNAVFEFDDEDEPLLDRILPQPDKVEAS